MASDGMTIADLIRESHATALEKGWWNEGEQRMIVDGCMGQQETVVKTRPRLFPELIALMHSELSEALEDWRKWGMDPTKFIMKPCFGEPAGEGVVCSGLAVELADVLIRIADCCGKYGIPLEAALRAKMAYNKTRPHRHGGKLA